MSLAHLPSFSIQLQFLMKAFQLGATLILLTQHVEQHLRVQIGVLSMTHHFLKQYSKLTTIRSSITSYIVRSIIGSPKPLVTHYITHNETIFFIVYYIFQISSIIDDYVHDASEFVEQLHDHPPLKSLAQRGFFANQKNLKTITNGPCNGPNTPRRLTQQLAVSINSNENLFCNLAIVSQRPTELPRPLPTNV